MRLTGSKNNVNKPTAPCNGGEQRQTYLCSSLVSTSIIILKNLTELYFYVFIFILLIFFIIPCICRFFLKCTFWQVHNYCILYVHPWLEYLDSGKRFVRDSINRKYTWWTFKHMCHCIKDFRVSGIHFFSSKQFDICFFPRRGICNKNKLMHIAAFPIPAQCYVCYCQSP